VFLSLAFYLVIIIVIMLLMLFLLKFLSILILPTYPTFCQPDFLSCQEYYCCSYFLSSLILPATYPTIVPMRFDLVSLLVLFFSKCSDLAKDLSYYCAAAVLILPAAYIFVISFN